MKLPPVTSSSWTHIGFASFTWASMNAWSEFTELPQTDRDVLAEQAKSVRAFIESLLKEARETQDQEIFGRPEAQAKQNAWLKLVHRVANEALTLVALRLGNGSKDSAPAREFLPNLLATISKVGVAERPGVAAQAAKRLAGLTGSFTEKAALADKLAAAAKGAEAAVKANESAFAARDKERGEEVVAKNRLRLELERAYKALGAHFVGQDDFVESLFLKGERASEGAEEEPAKEPEAKPA